MTVSAVCPPRLALSRSQRKRERNSSSDCWISHSDHRQPRMSPLISSAVAATRQPVGSLPPPASLPRARSRTHGCSHLLSPPLSHMSSPSIEADLDIGQTGSFHLSSRAAKGRARGRSGGIADQEMARRARDVAARRRTMPKPGCAGPAGVATPAADLIATHRCLEPLAQ